jgi:hypothetical protein
MRVEEGKYYRTRDGGKVGPMGDGGTAFDNNQPVLSARHGKHVSLWRLDGSHLFGKTHIDIVAEANTGPVRTVTRKEIVPGEYGKLLIFDDGSASVTDWTDTRALRDAARVFIGMADALDEAN